MTSYKKLFSNTYSTQAKSAFIIGVLCILGLFFSRAALSFASAGFGALALYQLFKTPRTWLNKPIIVTSIILVLYLLSSYFKTPNENLAEFIQEAGTRLAFLAILVPLVAQPLPEKMVRALLVVFCWCAFVVAFGTLVNYLLNFEEINIQISQSKPIPIITGHFHISFSYMLALAVLSGIALSFLWKGPERRVWLMVPLIGNFLLIHVIAARTGLVSMYAALLVVGFLYFAIEKKAPGKAALALVAMMGVGVLAISFIKPLNNRFKNTVVDVSNYLNGGNANWWSGGMRLEGLENGWHVFLDHPVTGVGMANLNDAVQEKYEERGTLLLEENRINPHNQFLSYLIAGGVVAFLLLMTILYQCFTRSWTQRNWLLMGFVVLSFVGFNLESFLERQFGSCLFALSVGLLFSLNFSRK